MGINFELIPSACIDLDGAAARGQVEAVVSQGDDASQRAYGYNGTGLADRACVGVRIEVEFAMAPCGKGLPLPAYCLLIGHHTRDADVQDGAAQGRALTDSHAFREGAELQLGQVWWQLVGVDCTLHDHCLVVPDACFL